MDEEPERPIFNPAPVHINVSGCSNINIKVVIERDGRPAVKIEQEALQLPRGAAAE